VTSPFARLETPRGLIALRWAIGLVLVFGMLGCVVKGANNPADPYLSPRKALAGFGETKVKVKTPEELLEFCLLLAANDIQRARGLMEVIDPSLGGYDGMLFRYDQDVTEKFWMHNTPMPLSIAFVDATGALVSTADMTPCEDSDQCPDYPPAGPYRTAIEVPQGKLPALHIVAGSTVTDERTRCR
jgi:uncharacterized membrane protein (UPF0127 family)